MTADIDARHQGIDDTEPAAGGRATRDEPLSEEEANRAAQPLAETSPAFALYGARHDFSVKDASGATACRCIAALLGPPSSGKLSWQGEMPRTKPETQLMLALIPHVDCEGAPKGSSGGSYWGYRVEGNDVVVLVEGWQPARPRTLGAIIPKPAEGGQVYLAPVAAGLPYGQGSNATRCALGNPGPKRSAPLAP